MKARFPEPTRALLAVGLSVLLAACGGGGGGGSARSGSPPSSGEVAFLGFEFRTAEGVQTSAPPVEDLLASPPSLGAPLNAVVVFVFSGVPEGPFNGVTLPVFTTPADLHPLAEAPADLGSVPAKGVYVPVGNTVEFHPFIPTRGLEWSLSAPADAVPGLVPGSTYTGRVSTTPGARIANLTGLGGEVRFDVTASPSSFFVPLTPEDGLPPALASASPEHGDGDFYPGAYAPVALGASEPTYPPGPERFVLTFDRPVSPFADNLTGRDLDGDGVLEGTFHLRSRATRLLVAHMVPEDTFGTHAPFPALSGLESAGATEEDVVFHAGPVDAIPGRAPDAAFEALPAAMAVGDDPSLLYLLWKEDGASDRLTVADHLLGDPFHAALAGPGAALDTGLDDAVGLAALADGRLVAYDRTTRRIHELVVEVERLRPAPGAPSAGPPTLVALATGDGVAGFRSDELTLGDVLDLAPSPSGELFALARLGGATTPSIVRLAPIDPDANGVFGPGEGTFSGDADDIIVTLSADYVSLELVGDSTALALNRDDDTIDVIDLALPGKSDVAVSDVASFGKELAKLPEGRSPAVAFAVGHVRQDVQVALVSNGPEGAVVELAPAGLLPVGRSVTVVQRSDFQSLFGASELTTDDGGSRWGGRDLLTVTTAKPRPGATPGFVDDVFFEDFGDDAFEDPEGTVASPPADWAAPTSGGGTSGGLRASTGVSELTLLGDFLPVPSPEFDPAFAFERASPTNGVELDLDPSRAMYKVVVLDTDAQMFPLFDGSTPGITEEVMVTGGRFAFRDFIVPEGVQVVVRGTRPLVITASRRVEIHGLIDAAGGDGINDDSFDTGFVPLPGGPGGPAAGRGGNGHPTVFDPTGTGAVNQFATPETGERGWGPFIDAAGRLSFTRVGGHGGLSTLGYDAAGNGFPKLDQASNTEHHRPPGGGGGSYFTVGDRSRDGAGVYLVQSSSSWHPFTRCPLDNGIEDALIGNEENKVNGALPDTPVQCVYMEGTRSDPVRTKPGAEPGDPVFVDGDPSNDFIGPGGELSLLFGGQGGGGGGSRIDCMRQKIWAKTNNGGPFPGGPPWYPLLAGPPAYSPTRYDAKGAGAGGGGGAVMIRSFGDIVIGRTGHIDCSGGHGGGGERLGNSGANGGGGGGSGGVIILQAAGEIVLEADPEHRSAGFTDADGAEGASLDVSGGWGRDAQTSPQGLTFFSGFGREYGRGDAGSGGFGLIQLQAGGGAGLPRIEPGAFAFAKQRGLLKQGPWTGDLNDQHGHEDFEGEDTGLPDDLRYIDLLEYRSFKPEGEGAPGVNTPRDFYYVLNGSYPPIIPVAGGVNGNEIVNEHPAGSGQRWFDTKLMEYPSASGRMVVQEPEPEKVMKTYDGWITSGPNQWLEVGSGSGDPPGTLFDAADVIPFSKYLNEPDPLGDPSEEESGTPIRADSNGDGIVDLSDDFEPTNLVDRLPVVHPSRTPPTFGTASRGISRWLDFHGVSLRARDAHGRTPPFFAAIHGTYNAAWASESPDHVIPFGKDGQVRLSAPVPGDLIPAHFVEQTGFYPFDPGLLDNGTNEPPFNDIKIDAPEFSLENALTDNATVTLLFQGAYAVRPGAHAPDQDTLTSWTSDLTQLDGYPLVRFQVLFDLGADPVNFPFGVDSLRPQVDYVRLRARY